MVDKYNFIPFHMSKLSGNEMHEKSEAFYNDLKKRRSIRHFSSAPFPRKVIENIIMTASSAPSGANKQPWTFCIIESAEMKKKIREAAEIEEKLNYHERMTESWLRDLAPLGTDEHKPFLEEAPYLIVVLKKSYDLVDGEKHKNYYVNESVGIASGFLIAAIHQAGLCTLTHTPSPMSFLEKILERPKNEKAILLLPVGIAADDCTVPDIDKKKFDEVAKWY